MFFSKIINQQDDDEEFVTYTLHHNAHNFHHIDRQHLYRCIVKAIQIFGSHDKYA